jgi:hypothetical protein
MKERYETFIVVWSIIFGSISLATITGLLIGLCSRIIEIGWNIASR